MSELAVDFIKDQSGIWWFLGVKAFKLEESLAKPVLNAFLPHHEVYVDQEDNPKKKIDLEKVSEYVKLRICRFC